MISILKRGESSETLITDISNYMMTEWSDFNEKHLKVTNVDEMNIHIQNTFFTGKVYPIMIIALEKERLVGFVSIDIADHSEYCMYKTWLNNLYVVPGKRGKGIGKHLISYALEYLKNNNFIEVYLCCESGLEGYYENYAFKRIAVGTDGLSILKSVFCQNLKNTFPISC